MMLDAERRPEASDPIWTVTAAYEDAATAYVAVNDLVRAGMSQADVTVMSPWPAGAVPVDTRERLLDHPLRLAVATGLGMAAILALAAMVWAGSDNWVLYAWVGMVVGVLGTTLAGALTATSPPNWHDRLLGDRLGAVTVEVNTQENDEADLARAVMASHDPSVVLTLAGPGPRAPEDHVMWDHEDGLSPLQEIGSWREARTENRPAQRGRHLDPGRVRG